MAEDLFSVNCNAWTEGLWQDVYRKSVSVKDEVMHAKQ
jgi:hypothetical protein